MWPSPLSAPRPGDTVTHFVRVANQGPENATNIRVDVSFTSGFSVIDHELESPDQSFTSTEWVVPTLDATHATTLTVRGTFDGPYTAIAKSLGADQVDGNGSDNTATWYAGPTAPGNPVPAAQIPAGAFWCIQGDDEGAAGYPGGGLGDEPFCVVDPTLAGAGADLVVTASSPRATTVPAGHVLFFGVGVERRNTTGAFTGIRVSASIPAGTRLIRAEPRGGGSYNASTGVWNVGALNQSPFKGLALWVETTGSGPVTLSRPNHAR